MNVYGCDLIDDRINKLKSVGIEAFNSSDTDYCIEHSKKPSLL